VPRRAISTRSTSSCQALGEAPARAVVGDLELGQAVGLQQRDLVVQPRRPSTKSGTGVRVAEVHLVDDRQHRDLEQDGVQPGPADRDVDLAEGCGVTVMYFSFSRNRPRKSTKSLLMKRSVRR
jgi:hypothetical protein